MKTPWDVQRISFVDGSDGSRPLNLRQESRLARAASPEPSIKECFIAYLTYIV